jgi:hypothetical protein
MALCLRDVGWICLILMVLCDHVLAPLTLALSLVLWAGSLHNTPFESS